MMFKRISWFAIAPGLARSSVRQYSAPNVLHVLSSSLRFEPR
jgi:hypothetical protein